eukprot:CFRG6137T1
MTKLNRVIMQYFQWYTLNNGELWNSVKEQSQHLADIGITALWLPPSNKAKLGSADAGYGVYDLYDMGEFYQKGTVRTKYGTKDEYVDAIAALHNVGIEAYADIVLNQRMGGDAVEYVAATPVSPENRLNKTGGLTEIKAWSSYIFPGRNGMYSDFQWHWNHFTAAGDEALEPSNDSSIYLFEDKEFSANVSHELGNYDYLVGLDVDYGDPEVRNETITWGKWMLDMTNVDGFRMDAVKHYSLWYSPEWLTQMRLHSGKDMFAVGEYWSSDLDILSQFINDTDGTMSLFDVPLQGEFANASMTGRGYNMSSIFDTSLVQIHPTFAVTFVSNHDTQPLQALQSVVEPWFMPIAYALTLLRQGGVPVIFDPDYYGAEYITNDTTGEPQTVILVSFRSVLDKYLYARKQFVYGEQLDYFDHVNIIGWTSLGDEEHPGSMAVVLSNGQEGTKTMNVGKPNTDYVDLMGYMNSTVTTDENGWAEFDCNEISVSVWIEADIHNLWVA